MFGPSASTCSQRILRGFRRCACTVNSASDKEQPGSCCIGSQDVRGRDWPVHRPGRSRRDLHRWQGEEQARLQEAERWPWYCRQNGRRGSQGPRDKPRERCRCREHGRPTLRRFVKFSGCQGSHGLHRRPRRLPWSTESRIGPAQRPRIRQRTSAYDGIESFWALLSVDTTVLTIA